MLIFKIVPVVQKNIGKYLFIYLFSLGESHLIKI